MIETEVRMIHMHCVHVIVNHKEFSLDILITLSFTKD